MKLRVITASTVVFLALSAGSGARAQTCSGDGAEPDDGCVSSATVIHGGEVQAHDFCDDAADWVRFNACAGRSYTIQTSSLGASADTVLELHDTSGSMLLASDDDGAGGRASRVMWSSPSDGVYHIRVRQADGTSGVNRSYVLGLTGDTSSCSTWNQSYGVGSAADVRQLADGGYVAAGSYPVSGGSDVWLVNVDPSGGNRWQRRYGVSSDTAFPSVRQTPDGGLLLAHRTTAFSSGGGGFKAWVLKLNALGVIEWQKAYGGSGDDAVVEIAATADAGFVMVGWTTRLLRSALWVLRADASGNVVWSYRYRYGAAGSGAVGRSIQQTADGGFIVGGEIVSAGGSSAIWLIKLDGMGGVEWQKQWAGVESLSLVRQDRDAGYAVVGLTQGFSPVPPNPAVWMTRLDGSGATLWQESFYNDGIYGSNAHSPYVAQLPDGDYVIATSFDSHAWLLRLSSSGHAVWDRKSAGDSSYEAVAVAADGGIATVGSPVVLRKFDAAGDVGSCSLQTEAYSIKMSTSANSTVTSLVREVFTPQVAVTTNASIPTAATSESECLCYTPAYTGSVTASHLTGGVRWSWTSAGPVTYDVVSGDLMTLHATAGDFTAAIDTDLDACLVNDTTALFVDDFTVPEPGEGRFVLLSAKSSSCLGTYNSPAPSAQHGDRDRKINAAPAACFALGDP